MSELSDKVSFQPVKPVPAPLRNRHVAIVSGPGGFHQMTRSEVEAVRWFLMAAGESSLIGQLDSATLVE